MAITMSSGKSRSMAAVLLLVAVVACTCAAGVQAQPSFTITNRCNKAITITTGASTITVPAGASVIEPLSPTAFFVKPVTVTVTGSAPTTIPGIVVDFINLQANLGLALQSVEIRCVGNNSFFIILTYQLPLFPGLLPLIFPFGPFFY